MSAFSQIQFQEDLVACLYRQWASPSKNSAATMAQAKRRAKARLLGLGYSQDLANCLIRDVEQALDLRLVVEGLR